MKKRLFALLLSLFTFYALSAQVSSYLPLDLDIERDTGNSDLSDGWRKVKQAPDMEWINSSLLGNELTRLLLSVKDAKRPKDYKNYYVGILDYVPVPEFRHESAYPQFPYPHTGFPGELLTSFTGLGVYFPNGEETQRIGIVPDIEIKPTIKGIREGRDEVLEKALEIIWSNDKIETSNE